MHCEPPFWEDVPVLFRHFSLQYKSTCEHSVYNFIARIMIVSFVVGLLAAVLGGLPFLLVVLLFGAITAAAIVLMSPLDKRSAKEERREERREQREERREEHEKKKCHDNCERTYNTYHELPMSVTVDPSRNASKEHFVNGGSTINSVQPYSDEPYGVVEVDATPYAGPSFPDYTPPTSKNLFMNVLLDEYKYNPDRPEAAPVGNPTVKQTLDDFFRVHWYSDPTDVFGKNQNQRQFVTQPSTTVPNDQGSFADWLYKIPGKTCKEGGRAACLAGTDGGLMPWLSQAS